MDGGKQGVGIQLEVRNFQWSNPLAEDIILTIYLVKNVSEKPLNQNIVGMYVDADVGQGESEDDISSFDIFFIIRISIFVPFVLFNKSTAALTAG